MATDTEKQIDVVDGTMTEEEAAKPEYVSQYKLYADSKIPVSKSTGKFWETRFKEGVAYLDKIKVKDRWDEAIRYYQNDQGARTGKRAELAQVSTGSDHVAKYQTENIVFANVSALVPATYAKNPDIEVTANDEQDETKALMYEKLVTSILQGNVAPCVALKNKAKRGVVTAFLTNVVYFEVSYTKKEQSNQLVIDEMATLSAKLEEAKDTKTLEETEGQLMMLEEKVSLLSDAGPQVRVKMPSDVVMDPNSEETDLSDCQYLMICDYLRTSYIRACYGEKDEHGEWKSVYEPTHLLSPQSGSDIAGHDDEINHFTILGQDDDYTKYGYKSEDEYNNAQRTKVWYVWDKVTRRVLMYNDKDWSWPIWVWDDPYRLTRFYPLVPLVFYTDPIDRFGRSEVMYYLDQQDELNNINHERSRMRHWVMTKVFVNTDKVADVTKVQSFLSQTSNENVMGLALGENADVQKAIATLAPPSAQFAELFDNKPILEAVNRLSSVTPVLKAAEFRTNTTNKAIESYQSSTQTRLDEKIDAIEDCISTVGSIILEMCVQFMDEEAVRKLISDKIVDQADGWEQFEDPRRWHEMFSFGIVGGSTLKPTSQAKKDMAIQLGQVLGQFAQANPAVVPVMLRVMERAFNEEIVISPMDWEQITQSTANAVQPQQAQGGGGGDEKEILNNAMQQVEQLFNSLDPQTRQQVGQAIARGAPLKAIVQGLLAKQGQQPAPPAPSAPSGPSAPAAPPQPQGAPAR